MGDGRENVCNVVADSAQTEYCSTFHCSCVRVFVCSCVTGVTSHISHIYKGITNTCYFFFYFFCTDRLKTLSVYLDSDYLPNLAYGLRGRCIKKSKKKLTSVSFAFTHTYTLEKLTLLLFSPKRTWKILKNESIAV